MIIRNDGALISIIPGLAIRLANSALDWNFTSVPQEGLNGRSVPMQRGHVLGGSSSASEYRVAIAARDKISWTDRLNVRRDGLY